MQLSAPKKIRLKMKKIKDKNPRIAQIKNNCESRFFSSSEKSAQYFTDNILYI